MHVLKRWSIATRIGTIALAIVSTILGGALAAHMSKFYWPTAIMAVLTASLLQLICNLANDYGDFVLGADPINQTKPPSAIQTGLVTLAQVRKGLLGLGAATIGSGVLLLYVANPPTEDIIVFLFLGACALVASVAYTLGDVPYGYRGWGDAAVFVFFGFLGVGGTFYLHTQQLHSVWVLPAVSYGSLVVGILNINNLRDRDTDAQVGKNTLPVRVGSRIARHYHAGLLILSTVSIQVFLHYYVSTLWPYACLCVLPWLLKNGIVVYHTNQEVERLNGQLSQLVLVTCIFGVLLSLGLFFEACAV